MGIFSIVCKINGIKSTVINNKYLNFVKDSDVNE